jgi:hypothetical protein
MLLVNNKAEVTSSGVAVTVMTHIQQVPSFNDALDTGCFD